jgi:SAM-dependent methyltransferase
MAVLPPGTLLQLMYLQERLKHIVPAHFLEIGPGSGEITQLLLSLGWTGISCDLDVVTVQRLNNRFANAVGDSRYLCVAADFLNEQQSFLPSKVDLVISCMVMEHLDYGAESTFIRKTASLLKPTGLMIGLVPGSPEHWGVEDDIAGHYRRYTRESISTLMLKNQWQILHLVGLTFPISNFLLPISNFLVKRSELSSLNFSHLERTKKSGKRNVLFKTHFPPVFQLLLNRYVLLPLHICQKMSANHVSAMVLYFEARPLC